ncbi:Kar1p [Lachancea thermotolerans CBS 6340]|uniref:KLTH0B07260p n=1 Tax=Lachancea thermotolerans (strain ATCC 56472 / CBS 6340 / NRRL Y-8284) TaxID=559295 RepID=C5DD04_LACTC|nr:KLTH0B07260p [Lachancea thermotolerans CBS 6340]CAR21665.1 KLTH0B07260p [Lachancea thermotolerans CBS 6340]
MSPPGINQSNLPSREYRIASESRIARINELYNRSQRQQKHRDSIISDNSTSVPYIQDEDDCQPLAYLAPNRVRRAPVAPPDSETIKPAPVKNPFRPKPTEERPFSEDDVERELQFTPKLMSRRSIVSSRTPSHGTPLRREGPEDIVPDTPVQLPIWFSKQVVPDFNNTNRAARRREAFKELKQKLGKPLPLGYLSDFQDEASRSTKKNVEERRKRMLSSKGRDISWHDTRSLSDESSGIHSPHTSASSGDFIAGELSATSTDDGFHQNISEGLRTNSEKLDQIMVLLETRKKAASKRECLAWIFCIIVLIALNLYLSNL